MSRLQQNHSDWFKAILEDIYIELPKWEIALLEVQKNIATEHEVLLENTYQIKINCHVRFIHFPPNQHNNLPFPNIDQIRLFREVKGTVIRASSRKFLELKRTFKCQKCSDVVEIESDYSIMYQFNVPKCKKPNCKSTVMKKLEIEPLRENATEYQDIKIQVICLYYPIKNFTQHIPTEKDLFFKFFHSFSNL